MAEIVNLNRFRKTKQRSEAQQRAAENRVRFGRSKAEKASDRDETARREQNLDAARRQESGGDRESDRNLESGANPPQDDSTQDD
ncbi:uncharacterized protein DUF4169 [Dongia mobilis]|uniref:Uncharacterized protein DUF4169 n=1 Tax=Dongia mobilis TaxID=578943 RepID=A0A4R6WUU1_9PROT|nr:DUF4169 family protein [Dongia mobilis]TDQ83463.1 uncharacterized protein DUF4169 [Dongia mobilis]